jgi:hypothetical protein
MRFLATIVSSPEQVPFQYSRTAWIRVARPSAEISNAALCTDSRRYATRRTRNCATWPMCPPLSTLHTLLEE